MRAVSWSLPLLSLIAGCASAPPIPRGDDSTLRALEAVLREHGWPCSGVARYETAAEPNRFRAWCVDGEQYEVLLTEEAMGGAGPRRTSLYPLFEVSRQVERLRGTDVAGRRAAADRLRRLGSQAAAAVPQLVTALADPDPGVRAAAASALGAVGETGDVVRRALSDATRDPDPEVRASATAALAKLIRG